ncbi:glycosyltransferase [Dehalococcoidia bacterium]|nr:glycosyltransferase [Dehalococcoidia bacterium]
MSGGELVSVLVPARNEETKIGLSLAALVLQRYTPMEILVLDDDSGDNTLEIIGSFEQRDDRIRVIKGKELPEGWIGKNWACHQLFNEAKGNYLLFVDADTILAPGAITASVHQARSQSADLLTVMPKRMAGCVAEKLMYPFLDWFLFSWLPMRAAHKRKNSYLSASFGQFMLFKKESYNKIGGHYSIWNNPLDDFSLGRMVKKSGLKWLLFSGAGSVDVLAGKGNVDAFMSISRSLFPAINYSFMIFMLLFSLLFGMCFIPISTIVGFDKLSSPGSEFVFISYISLSLIAISWVIVCKKFEHSIITVVFYPLCISLMFIAAWHSVIAYNLRLTTWKDRRLFGGIIK